VRCLRVLGNKHARIGYGSMKLRVSKVKVYDL